MRSWLAARSPRGPEKQIPTTSYHLVQSLLREVVGAAQRAGVPIETTWVTGSFPAEDIVRLATEVQADLIVMRT